MSACQTILKTTLASLLLLTVYGRGVTLELMSHVIELANNWISLSLTHTHTHTHTHTLTQTHTHTQG